MLASADVCLILFQMQCRPNSHSYSSSRVLLRGWNGGRFVYEPSAVFLSIEALIEENSPPD